MVLTTLYCLLETKQHVCGGSLTLLEPFLKNKLEVYFNGVERKEFNMYSQRMFLWQVSGNKPGFLEIFSVCDGYTEKPVSSLFTQHLSSLSTISKSSWRSYQVVRQDFLPMYVELIFYFAMYTLRVSLNEDLEEYRGPGHLNDCF